MSTRDPLTGILRQWAEQHGASPETPEVLTNAYRAEVLAENRSTPVKRLHLNPVHGQQCIHVELTKHDIRDILDDDLNNPQFPATRALAEIFEEALTVFGRASSAAGQHGSGTAVCGLPHYDYPESTCSEPAGHDGPHAAELIIRGRYVGAVSWDTPDEKGSGLVRTPGGDQQLRATPRAAPARLLAAAVAELRSALPGDDVAIPGGAIPARLAEPLAAWLEIAHGYVVKSHPDLALATPFRRGAIDVARAILEEST